jgi:hypothetical protein
MASELECPLKQNLPFSSLLALLGPAKAPLQGCLPTARMARPFTFTRTISTLRSAKASSRPGCRKRSGYDVIADGIVGLWFLEPFRAATALHEISLDYAVLRPSSQVSLERARNRDGEGLKDEEAIRGLCRAFGDLGALEPHCRRFIDAVARRDCADHPPGTARGALPAGVSPLFAPALTLARGPRNMAARALWRK